MCSLRALREFFVSFLLGKLGSRNAAPFGKGASSSSGLQFSFPSVWLGLREAAYLNSFLKECHQEGAVQPT